MRIFLSAGEASGDAYGASLVREIKKASDQDFTEASLKNWLGIRPTTPDDAPLVGLRSTKKEGFNVLLFQLADFWSIGEGGYDLTSLNVRELLDLLRQSIAEAPIEVIEEWSAIQFEGIGGPKLLEEGVHLYANSSHWGAISIAQAAKVFFKIYRTLHQLKHNLRKGPPGLLIAIDFGYANIRLCRYAKKHGWKVLYFVPPGSWRRDRQGKDLPLIADEIVTPFEWSAEILTRMGAKAHWFGHPIKQLIAQASKDDSKEERASVAILPGSRKHELEMNLPLIAAAMRGLPAKLEFALAPSIEREEIQAEWTRLSPDRSDLFTVADTYAVLQRGRAGIICSGTATLEAVLCRCPMVVVYQLSPSMRREANFLMKVLRKKRPKFIALPNIIMDREIVPELADENGVDPVEVRMWLDKLLEDEEIRNRQLRDFAQLDLALGPSDAITKTAELALRMMS
jgi:lipid-A-disaccharide synthase